MYYILFQSVIRIFFQKIAFHFCVFRSKYEIFKMTISRFTYRRDTNRPSICSFGWSSMRWLLQSRIHVLNFFVFINSFSWQISITPTVMGSNVFQMFERIFVPQISKQSHFVVLFQFYIEPPWCQLLYREFFLKITFHNLLDVCFFNKIIKVHCDYFSLKLDWFVYRILIGIFRLWQKIGNFRNYWFQFDLEIVVSTDSLTVITGRSARVDRRWLAFVEFFLTWPALRTLRSAFIRFVRSLRILGFLVELSNCSAFNSGWVTLLWKLRRNFMNVLINN